MELYPRRYNPVLMERTLTPNRVGGRLIGAIILWLLAMLVAPAPLRPWLGYIPLAALALLCIFHLLLRPRSS
jgi:hypothetical protein